MVSTSISEIVEKNSMVGSETTMAGVDRATISSKIVERGEIFHVGSEVITVEAGVTSVSY